ncbi:MAG: hypothetical protein ACE5EM_06015, partial [Sphingomonadales bacterium]
MRARGFWCAVLGLLALSACGFRTLHGEHPGHTEVTARLAEIEIAPIPDHIGQTLRNELLDRIAPFGTAGKTRYRLDVRLELEDEGLGFRDDESITRINLRLDAHFRLVELETGDDVLKEKARALVSYNVVQSDFANLSADRDARRRAV